MFPIALAVLLAAAATPTPDATPAPEVTPVAEPSPVPSSTPAPSVLARGAAIRIVLDDGAVVEGTIGDLSNLAILVRLPAGGFRVVDRAHVVEPQEATLESTVKELRDAAVGAPVPGPPESTATPWGGWITIGFGPGSVGSGAAGAFTVRYHEMHTSFRYENRREAPARREPEVSNYSFGVLGGRTWRFRKDLVRVTAEGGAGLMWGQERGAFIDTEERGPGCPGSANCDTFYVYETERYRAPALLGDVSVSLHPRIGFCAPDSTGIGIAVSGAVRRGGADGLLLVFLQLGAL